KAFSPPGTINPSASTLYSLLSTGAMPLNATQYYPPGWDEFQTGGNNPPPNPTLVADLQTWIQAGSVYDIPNQPAGGVIGQIPTNPPGELVTGAVSPYVLSMPGDTGCRPP